MPVVLALATFLSTSLGGAFALRNRGRIQRILGFTAGVILGVVAFDVLPEMASLARSTGVEFTTPMIALVIGFLAFHGVEKWLLVHAHEDADCDGHHPSIGLASALALSGHSFTDGVAIGLGFQVGNTVGVAVAIAVIGHDFADGLNTVSLMLAHGNGRRRAATLLGLDALAPVLGAASTLFFTVPDRGLLIYLGVFAGFLLYIGAADVLPEAHAGQPSLRTYFLTVLGAGFIYLVVRTMP
jgi:zinc transporter ZupT